MVVYKGDLSHVGNFQQLMLELRAQGLPQQVRNFSGEGGKRFSEWIRDIGKAGVSVSANDSRLVGLALQTSTGLAGNFVLRHIKANPNISSRDLKAILSARFSDHSDQQFTLQKLRRAKQSHGESVQAFGDKLINLADDAYNLLHTLSFSRIWLTFL
ncbi:hypothetical protein LOTGIDRAFT_173423 [Lottia gigantea]|uniref:Retrotransposon gag domain-containing protein n=1 Tax=Lottia gigantea TaxID=225164 RepID=V4AYK2_LOTGI|nr:hypothetical protein LOTGIDRAFT_173423 [Lottia gigantea]ESP00186.1 hypothetical protein LOTGIDRAFT_173423 [Lottia gigantea]